MNAADLPTMMVLRGLFNWIPINPLWVLSHDLCLDNDQKDEKLSQEKKKSDIKVW